MKRSCFVTMLFLIATAGVFAQAESRSERYSAQLERQLACTSNPKAGKFLINLRRTGFISTTYVVFDTVSYFRLRRPLGVWSFNPLAVFGWEGGFDRFFVRGPGTSPPEMIGIVVRASVPAVNAKLRKLGIEGLNVEKAEFNLRGKLNTSGAPLTEISCRTRLRN